MVRTDQEIVDQADALARRMAEDVIGYQFAEVTGTMRSFADPRVRMCWNMACCAIEELQQTDVYEALRNVEDHEATADQKMRDGATF